MRFQQAFLAGPRAVNGGWYFHSGMGAPAANDPAPAPAHRQEVTHA